MQQVQSLAPPTRMALSLEYEVLDVFTSKPFSGNPLAIVTLASDIPQARKQQIAKEFNLSETVFRHKYDAVGHGVRIDIFTPEAEIPFAGHPTVGSAFSVLGQSGADTGILNIKAGQVPISKGQDGYIYAVVPHDVHRHSVKPTENAVVVSVVKGMTFILIELESNEELASKNAEIALSVKELDRGWQQGLVGTYYYVFQSTDKSKLRCRMFTSFDSSGIEDAATGSAACTLGAYLSGESRATSMRLQIEQGVEMGRPSEIIVLTQRDGGALTTMTLGGQAVRLMKGTMTF